MCHSISYLRFWNADIFDLPNSLRAKPNLVVKAHQTNPFLKDLKHTNIKWILSIVKLVTQISPVCELFHAKIVYPMYTYTAMDLNQLPLRFEPIWGSTSLLAFMRDLENVGVLAQPYKSMCIYIYIYLSTIKYVHQASVYCLQKWKLYFTFKSRWATIL